MVVRPLREAAPEPLPKEGEACGVANRPAAALDGSPHPQHDSRRTPAVPIDPPPRPRPVVALESHLLPPDATEALWRFSLDLYARPGVAEACLALQGRRGADVNLLLLILWLARRGRPLEEPVLKAAGAVARDWQSQVVGPVRAARRAAKQAAGPDLYHRLKDTELACEQAEQAALVAAVARTAGGSADTGPAPEAERPRLADLGLRSYLSGLTGRPTDEEEAWITALVFAAFE